MTRRCGPCLGGGGGWVTRSQSPRRLIQAWVVRGNDLRVSKAKETPTGQRIYLLSVCGMSTGKILPATSNWWIVVNAPVCRSRPHINNLK